MKIKQNWWWNDSIEKAKFKDIEFSPSTNQDIYKNLNNQLQKITKNKKLTFLEWYQKIYLKDKSEVDKYNWKEWLLENLQNEGIEKLNYLIKLYVEFLKN